MPDKTTQIEDVVERMLREWKRSMLTFWTLGLLATRPMYGLEIKNEIEHSAQGALTVRPSTIANTAIHKILLFILIAFSPNIKITRILLFLIHLRFMLFFINSLFLLVPELTQPQSLVQGSVRNFMIVRISRA